MAAVNALTSPDRPDRGATLLYPAGWILLAILLAIHISKSLASTITSSLDGYLAHDGTAERAALENAEVLFYYGTCLLVPALGGAAYLLSRGLTTSRGGGLFLATGGLIAVVCSVPALYAGSLPGWQLVGTLALVLTLVTVLPWFHVRLYPLVQGWASDLRKRLPGMTYLLAASTSFTVFALSVGPRSTGELQPWPVLARMGAVWSACALLLLAATHIFRFNAKSGASTPPRLVQNEHALAFRHFTWLLLIRWDPSSTPLIALVLILSVGGTAWSLIRSARTAEGTLPISSGGWQAGFIPWVFLPLLVLTVVFHRDVHGEIDLFHAGEWLTPAAEYVQGKFPYRDIYLQHGLIHNVLRPLAAFKLLGMTYESDRIAQNFLYALSHASFLLLLLSILRSRVLALVFALALASPGLFLSPRFIFLFLALFFVLIDLRQSPQKTPEALRERRRWPLVAAGVATALAIFHSIDVGVYVLTGLLLYLTIEGASHVRSLKDRPLRNLGYYLLGCLLGASPFVIYLAQASALPAFLENSLAQLSLQGAVWGIAYPGPSAFGELFRNSPTLGDALSSPLLTAFLAASGFVAALTWCVIRIGRRRAGVGDLALLLLAMTGALLFRSALGRSDADHLAYGSIMLWPLLALMVERALQTNRGEWQKASSRVLLALTPLILVSLYLISTRAPLYGFVRHVWHLSGPMITEPGGGYSHVPLPRVGRVLLPEDQAKALTTFDAYLKENLKSDETFFDFSNMGALYFLVDRPCPSRFVMPVYAATDSMQQRLIDDLERTRPRLAISSPILGMENLDGVAMTERLPLVTSYLLSHYVRKGPVAFGTVYERIQETD